MLHELEEILRQMSYQKLGAINTIVVCSCGWRDSDENEDIAMKKINSHRKNPQGE